MQIRVKCKCGEGSCQEWAIVELQGVVEAQPPFQDRLQNLEIGTLCRPSAQEVYTFTVGYHELTGSKVPLKKPLLVLKKIKHPDANADQSCESNTKVEVELQVVGIIRHRILFKTRPKALISSKNHRRQQGRDPASKVRFRQINQQDIVCHSIKHRLDHNSGEAQGETLHNCKQKISLSSIIDYLSSL